MAAWWQTASTPSSAARTASGARTSAAGSPRTSNTTGSCPRSRNAVTTWDPMNPAPPVTSTRMPSR